MPNFDSIYFKPTRCEAFKTKAMPFNLHSEARAAEREYFDCNTRNRIRREEDERRKLSQVREEEERRHEAKIRELQQFKATPMPNY